MYKMKCYYLLKNDVINGNFNGINQGSALATFLMKSKQLFDYVDDNPFIEMRTADFREQIIRDYFVGNIASYSFIL